MTDRPPPRVAVVGVRRRRQGLGQWIAKHLVRRGVQVPAFVATTPETAAEGREVLARHGIDARGFTNLRDLLAAEPVEALVIASPAETHLGWLEQALDARLHVLCEKPFVWGIDGAADRGAEIVREFHVAGLVLHENCPWPFTLPAYRALHPAATGGAVREFAMWLCPSGRGVSMLTESLSHPLSLLQALTPPGDARIEAVGFSTRDPQTAKVEVSFKFLRGGARVDALVRLETRAEQPRPAGYAVNGLPAERRVRMEDYAQTFEDGARRVDVPDPMEDLVGEFAAALRSPEPEAAARRRRHAIAERLRLLEEVALAFGGAA